MSFLKILQISCLSVLLHSSVHAMNDSKCISYSADCCCLPATAAQSHFGTATLSAGPDMWYTIETNSYPETTPLSFIRNKGVAEGNVFLSPTGFTVGEAGNYWATVTAILQNPTEDSTILIPVYLIRDDVFDPDDVSPVGGVVTLDTGKINTVQGSGVLKNVAAGTRLSIVATNAGYPLPVPITVVSWSISLFKMP